MKRPIEHEYTSHVAYSRALEEYCTWLEVNEKFTQFGNSEDVSKEIVGVPV